MLKVKVTRWHSTRPYLGVGTYYRKPDKDNENSHGEWITVSPEKPLLLDSRQVRMLIEKYGTGSNSDDMTALAGALDVTARTVEYGT